MSDNTSQDDSAEDEKPSKPIFSKLTAIVAGIAALLVAGIALRDAVAGLWGKHSSAEAPTQASSASPSVPAQLAPGNVQVGPHRPVTAEYANLPTYYSRPNGVVQRLLDGQWRDMDLDGGNEQVFMEISRDGGYTLLFNEDRQSYLRFPNVGGLAAMREWEEGPSRPLYNLTPSQPIDP